MDKKNKIKLINLYESSVSRKEQILKLISNNPNEINSRLLSLKGNIYFYFLYHYLIKNDIKKVKQSLYVIGKIDIFRNKHSKSYPNQINSLVPILVSDSKELLNDFKKIEYTKVKNYKQKLQYGQIIGFIIQEILRDNKAKALELLQIYEDKHKKYALKEQDIAILKAIINKNEKEVEELLEFFLLPKNYKKCSENSFYDKLYSPHILSLAKLAWIKGIKVEIDHPLLPKELLPIKPNKEYKIEYKFLQSDYKPTIKIIKEVPKPNAKYRNDKPKNKIGITKELLVNLIKENWKATYTEQELQKNVDLIYLAFTNPREFDKNHYDISKMANMHIANRDKDHIYIESKPFTNLWTIMKGNELLYFIDVLGLCFDVMGINQLNDEQHTTLKKKLETNQNKNTGFFGKWFN